MPCLCSKKQRSPLFPKEISLKYDRSPKTEQVFKYIHKFPAKPDIICISYQSLQKRFGSHHSVFRYQSNRWMNIPYNFVDITPARHHFHEIVEHRHSQVDILSSILTSTEL